MYIKDIIREYFESMLSAHYDLESAKDNLMDIVIEIASEFEEEEDI